MSIDAFNHTLGLLLVVGLAVCPLGLLAVVVMGPEFTTWMDRRGWKLLEKVVNAADARIEARRKRIEARYDTPPPTAGAVSLAEPQRGELSLPCCPTCGRPL